MHESTIREEMGLFCSSHVMSSLVSGLFALIRSGMFFPLTADIKDPPSVSQHTSLVLPILRKSGPNTVGHFGIY